MTLNITEEAKILSKYEFENHIKQLENETYKEEVKSFSEALKGLSDKDKSELASWIMRQYFNPDKNTKDFWYSSIPTEETVLRFIYESHNNFPHTLAAVVDQHKLNKSLRKTLLNLYDEEDIDLNLNKNMVGEMTLKDVGQYVGNVTPTMVNKLTDKALQKCKTFIELFDHIEYGIKFKKYFDFTIKEMAKVYYETFQEEETLDDAIASLLANGIVKTKDLQYISSKEFEHLEDLFIASKVINLKDFQNILLNDLFNYSNKKYEIFQYSISRLINPDDKSGRKKDNEDV